MWPFKHSRSKWLSGLLCAEQAVKDCQRMELESSIQCAKDFGFTTDFDRGALDYFRHCDDHGTPARCAAKFDNELNFGGAHVDQVCVMLEPLPIYNLEHLIAVNTLRDLRHWIEQVRDEVLQPVAIGDGGKLGRSAEGLGGHVPALLKQLDTLISGDAQ